MAVALRCPGAFAALLRNAAIDKGLQIPLETRRASSEKLRQLRQVSPVSGWLRVAGRDLRGPLGAHLECRGLRTMRYVLRVLRHASAKVGRMT